MGRYRFIAEYLGTDFNGWQKQPGLPSIQQALEDAFSRCLRETVEVVGSGRTDAGVHALGQVAHFDTRSEVDAGAALRSVNALTPRDLVIRELVPCRDDFHARYEAITRRYRYTLLSRPTAWERKTAWQVTQSLDAGLFRKELEGVLGDRDFNRFSIPRKDGRSTRCKVTEATLEIREARMAVYLEADRFLHKMVRSIVGACYDVARGQRPAGLVKRILEGKPVEERTWAPAHGLCLLSVRYPDFSS